MSISSLSTASTTSLLSQLEANGLSASKAQLVQDDLSQVEASEGAGGSASAPVDMETMRAALDKKIDDDVASGKLSQSDADAVKKTLDEMDGQSDATGGASQASAASSATTQAADPASSASSGAQGGGGGSGGGSSTKTEVSESVTISGPLKTTVVTYSDGSTTSTTTVATDSDEQKYGEPQPAQSAAAASTAATKYLATLAPGTMLDKLA